MNPLFPNYCTLSSDFLEFFQQILVAKDRNDSFICNRGGLVWRWSATTPPPSGNTTEPQVPPPPPFALLSPLAWFAATSLSRVVGRNGGWHGMFLIPRRPPSASPSHGAQVRHGLGHAAAPGACCSLAGSLRGR